MHGYYYCCYDYVVVILENVILEKDNIAENNFIISLDFLAYKMKIAWQAAFTFFPPETDIDVDI